MTEVEKRALRVHFKIKGCQVKNLDDKIEVNVSWERNGKITPPGRAGKLGPNKSITRFGETFALKINADYQFGVFKDRESKLTLYVKGDSSHIIGSAKFNLGDYANKGSEKQNYLLKMENCKFDNEAFFDLEMLILEITEEDRENRRSGRSSITS